MFQNKIIGLIGALAAAFCTAIFLICLILGFNEITELISFVSCLILSWSYLFLASTLYFHAEESRKVAAIAGFAFALLYAVFIGIVQFVEISYVRLNPESSLHDLLHYTPGSLMFALDYLGYGMLAISLFFIGLTLHIKWKTDKWLKVLLMINGLFFFPCVLKPLFTVETSNFSSNDILSLIFWCLVIIPTMILAATYLHRREKTN